MSITEFLFNYLPGNELVKQVVNVVIEYRIYCRSTYVLEVEHNYLG